MKTPLSRCQYDTVRPERIQPLQLAEGVKQHHPDETGQIRRIRGIWATGHRSYPQSTMFAVFGGFGLGEIAFFQTLGIWTGLCDTVCGYGSVVPAGTTGAAYPGQE